MIFPCLMVAAGCAAYFYQSLNPKAHPYPKLAARVRIPVGGLVMILVTIAAYRMPIELSVSIQSYQQRLVQTAIDRKRQLAATEVRHTRDMIRVLGGHDKYLAYLHSQEISQ